MANMVTRILVLFLTEQDSLCRSTAWITMFVHTTPDMTFIDQRHVLTNEGNNHCRIDALEGLEFRWDQDW